MRNSNLTTRVDIDSREVSCWMKHDGTWWTAGVNAQDAVVVYEVTFKAVKARMEVIAGALRDRQARGSSAADCSSHSSDSTT